MKEICDKIKITKSSSEGGIGMLGKKEAVQRRFNVLSSENVEMKTFTVIQDKHTGVQYLVTEGMQGISVNPLIDGNGKVIVSPVEIEEK